MILCRLIKAFLVYCFALFGSSNETMQAGWTVLLCSYWNQGHPAIFFANWWIAFEGWNNRFPTKYNLLDGEEQATWKQHFFLSRRKTQQYIFARTSTVISRLINRAGGLHGRILTEVVSTDRTQWGLYTRPRSRFQISRNAKKVSKISQVYLTAVMKRIDRRCKLIEFLSGRRSSAGTIVNVGTAMFRFGAVVLIEKWVWPSSM